MNNRVTMGLALGAGYLLGRTKKAKFAFAVGTMVMGKKLQLSPRAIADFASSQLQNNPQFKEIGDQLRNDMRGVGKAATGALLTRQINAVADRLHDRTLGVKDQLSGAVPDKVSGKVSGRRNSSDDDSEEADEADDRDDDREESQRAEQSDRQERPRRKKTASSATGAAQKAPAKKTAAKKTAAKKTTAAAKGGRNRG
ncbi:DNA primase [Streptomyces hypolithicus]